MGSKLGYDCHYWFSMVDEQEINSLHKLDLIKGVIAILFEIRTRFILKTRREGGVADVDIDSEKFDALTYAHEDEKKDPLLLSYTTYYRLEEYWMSDKEMRLLIDEAIAFAKRKAAEPENASLKIIPVVVHLEVCTVQQEGELFDSAMERAIRARNLVPLYLWTQPTSVERKPMTGMFMNFLKGLDRIRVEDIDAGLALMQVCHICKRTPTVGAQISSLSCNHAFHSHCLVRWLEEINVCPFCHSQAYDRYITLGPPFQHCMDQLE